MAVNLPTFEDREKLTAGKLNLLRDAIENKFSAITGADLTWPLVAQGHIDMGGLYSIVGLRTFWNIVNAAEYATLQAAIDAAVASGGGCVLIPPYTTIVADGVNLGGSDISIIGCGASSVIQLTSASTSGFLIQTATGLNNLAIMNLTLDGQSTGTAQKGIRARQVNGFHMSRVWVKDFTGDAVELTNDGTNGNACMDVRLTDLNFSGGSAKHITGNDVNGLQMSQVVSRSCADDAILLEPAAAAGLIRDIQLSNVKVASATGRGIAVLGSSAVVTANQSRIKLDSCQTSGVTGDNFQIGDASKIVQHATATNCTAHDSGANAFTVCSSGGYLADSYGYSAVTDGVDLNASINFRISDCDLRDAGQYGVNGDTSTTCVVINNDLSGAGTEALFKDNATSLRHSGNIGTSGPTMASVTTYRPNFSPAGAGGSGSWTITIPGGTLSQDYDLMRVTVQIGCSGAASEGSWSVTLGGISMLAGVGRGPSPNRDAAGVGYLWRDPAVADQVRTFWTSWNNDDLNTNGVRVQDSGGTLDLSVDQTLSVNLNEAASTDMTLLNVVVELIGGSPQFV